MSRHIKTKIAHHDQSAIGGANIHIMDISVQIEGRNIICTGIGETKKEALLKARSEAAERFAYLSSPRLKSPWRITGHLPNGRLSIEVLATLGDGGERWVDLHSLTPCNSYLSKGRLLSSHGFAAHIDQGLAAESAFFEILERYLNYQFSMNCMMQVDRICQRSSDSDAYHWDYYYAEFDVWHTLACVFQDGTAGWGGAVRKSRGQSYKAAIREGAAMALSYRAYGVRGNAVTVITSGPECLSNTSIGMVKHQPIYVDEEKRYICQAALIND